MNVPINEEIILKYAPSHIVHDFKESIKAYIDTNIQQHTWMMGAGMSFQQIAKITGKEENLVIALMKVAEAF